MPLDADLDDVLALGVDSILRGSGPDRWWQVGPRLDLLGQFPTGDRLPVAFDDLGPFLDVDLGDTVVPVVVSGRVDEDQPRVAVAVNGRIAAVTDTYDDPDGGGRFAVLVPPDLLVDGVNRVSVHRPGPVGPRPG
jgi:hypothetical protein